ncbi:hypothetical protein PCK1_002133 [Pneumocystis canis]|nr:hypothetical protein PCK1_002133 [Pneumocystis canis]
MPLNREKSTSPDPLDVLSLSKLKNLTPFRQKGSGQISQEFQLSNQIRRIGLFVNIGNHNDEVSLGSSKKTKEHVETKAFIMNCNEMMASEALNTPCRVISYRNRKKNSTILKEKAKTFHEKQKKRIKTKHYMNDTDQTVIKNLKNNLKIQSEEKQEIMQQSEKKKLHYHITTPKKRKVNSRDCSDHENSINSDDLDVTLASANKLTKKSTCDMNICPKKLCSSKKSLLYTQGEFHLSDSNSTDLEKNILLDQQEIKLPLDTFNVSNSFSVNQEKHGIRNNLQELANISNIQNVSLETKTLTPQSNTLLTLSKSTSPIKNKLIEVSSSSNTSAKKIVSALRSTGHYDLESIVQDQNHLNKYDVMSKQKNDWTKDEWRLLEQLLIKHGKAKMALNNFLNINIKTLFRPPSLVVASRLGDQNPMPRNFDSAIHPFERAREYIRALNSVKLDRMFAKPFIGQLGNGHIDGVYCIVRDPRKIDILASGSADGVIKIWNLIKRDEMISINAHSGIVKGLTYTTQGHLLSCSMDKTVKLWSSTSVDPINIYMGTNAFSCVDHHYSDPIFATSSTKIDVWDENRDKPIFSMEWGADTIQTVKFNQTETNILASAGADRSLILYDIRTTKPLSKLITQLQTNSISFNPMEAFTFAAASDDHNCYIYDMRNLNSAKNVLKDHVSAVMDVDFSPTGQELVTAGYDRTVRIFNLKGGHSRDIYHTKRMQRVFSAKFTSDSNYILSGSDDGNVRLWRAHASSRMHVLSTRERTKKEYTNALKQRYKHMPEIKRISNSRNIPKIIVKMQNVKKEELTALKQREENKRRHSKPDSIPYTQERKKHIVAVKQ